MKTNKEPQLINQDVPVANTSERRVLPMWLFRILAALAFDIVVSLILMYVSLHFAGAWYNSHHTIPDPVARGDDLGLSLFGFSWAFTVFFVSFPVLFILFYKSIKKYLKDN